MPPPEDMRRLYRFIFVGKRNASSPKSTGLENRWPKLSQTLIAPTWIDSFLLCSFGKMRGLSTEAKCRTACLA